MKIVFDTEKNTVKVGSKTFGVDMPIENKMIYYHLLMIL